MYKQSETYASTKAAEIVMVSTKHQYGNEIRTKDS